MEKKTILAIVLSVAVVFIYQFFFAPKSVPNKTQNHPAEIEEKKQPETATAPATATTTATANQPSLTLRAVRALAFATLWSNRFRF